jgi:hypothetical protein
MAVFGCTELCSESLNLVFGNQIRLFGALRIWAWNRRQIPSPALSRAKLTSRNTELPPSETAWNRTKRSGTLRRTELARSRDLLRPPTTRAEETPPAAGQVRPSSPPSLPWRLSSLASSLHGLPSLALVLLSAQS